MSATGRLPLTRRIFTERRAVLLPLLVAVVVNVGVLALAVLPLRQGVTGAEQAALGARLNLATAKAADKTAKDARAGKERADLEMKKFYAEILPRDFQGAANLIAFWPMKIAKDTGVNFRTGTAVPKAVQEPSNLVKVSGKAALTGEYGNIRRFLYEIETAEQFVIIESVELSQTGTAQSAGVLEVTLEISTYYVDERAPVKPQVQSTKSGAQ